MACDADDDRRSQVVDGIGAEAQQARSVRVKPGDTACPLEEIVSPLLV
jgi:hypothetical protein